MFSFRPRSLVRTHPVSVRLQHHAIALPCLDWSLGFRCFSARRIGGYASFCNHLRTACDIWACSVSGSCVSTTSVCGCNLIGPVSGQAVFRNGRRFSGLTTQILNLPAAFLRRALLRIEYVYFANCCVRPLARGCVCNDRVCNHYLQTHVFQCCKKMQGGNANRLVRK